MFNSNKGLTNLRHGWNRGEKNTNFQRRILHQKAILYCYVGNVTLPTINVHVGKAMYASLVIYIDSGASHNGAY